MAESLKSHMDNANPNTLADGLRILGLGGMIRALPTALRRKAGALDASQLATLHSLSLSKEAPAATILRAYARATSAAGTLGELAVQAFGATPADAQIAVAPNGDIVLLAASAYTDVDVDYMPMKGDQLVLGELPVVSNDLVLPSFVTAAPSGAIYLMTAVATAGTTPGQKIVLVPQAGAPAAGRASLNVAKNTVRFAVADAVTKAIVTLLICSAKDVDALMSAASPII